VTWNNASAENAWTSSGGDYATTTLSSARANPTTLADGDTLTFGSSLEFVTLINSSVGGTLNLILITPELESEAGRGMIRFNSKYFKEANGPKLTVNYVDIPESSAYAKMSAALSLLLIVRRRRRLNS
jgi:hypothetical protein